MYVLKTLFDNALILFCRGWILEFSYALLLKIKHMSRSWSQMLPLDFAHMTMVAKSMEKFACSEEAGSFLPYVPYVSFYFLHHIFTPLWGNCNKMTRA